jgi:hypothetical protein
LFVVVVYHSYNVIYYKYVGIEEKTVPKIILEAHFFKKKAAKIGRHAQAHADKKTKDYGINTSQLHKAIIYSVSFWFFYLPC